MIQKAKLIVWLIGSNSSGKTTQSRMLHDFFGNGKMEVNKRISPMGFNLKYTTFGSNIANLGVIQDTDCCGADTISLKEDMVMSYQYACEASEIVVVDAIMATGSYIEFLRHSIPDPVKILLVHLDISEEANFQRVRSRRATKRGKDLDEEQLSLKTRQNLAGKIKGFKSLFQRMQPLVDKAIIVNAELPREKIQEFILCEIKNLLD